MTFVKITLTDAPDRAIYHCRTKIISGWLPMNLDALLKFIADEGHEYKSVRIRVLETA